jgi:hypothetical protein
MLAGLFAVLCQVCDIAILIILGCLHHYSDCEIMLYINEFKLICVFIVGFFCKC